MGKGACSRGRTVVYANRQKTASRFFNLVNRELRAIPRRLTSEGEGRGEGSAKGDGYGTVEWQVEGRGSLSGCVRVCVCVRLRCWSGRETRAKGGE